MTTLVLSILVSAIASYRLTRIVTDDSITRPFRMRLWREGVARNPRYHDGEVHPGGWYGHLYGFVTCPFCMGWWFSLGVWALWRHPWGSLGVTRWCLCAAAVAGAQAFIAAKEG